MSHVFAVSAEVSFDAESWYRVLETFRVPFILYNPAGRRDHISPTVVAELSKRPGAAALLAVADRLACEAIDESSRRYRIGPDAAARELEIPAFSLTLSAHLLAPTNGPWAAIVVFRPGASLDGAAIPSLSRRENEVAALIGAGLSTKEIAHRLGISPHTTRHHTERIFARLRVSSRASVAALIGEQRRTNHGPTPHSSGVDSATSTLTNYQRSTI